MNSNTGVCTPQLETAGKVLSRRYWDISMLYCKLLLMLIDPVYIHFMIV